MRRYIDADVIIQEAHRQGKTIVSVAFIEDMPTADVVEVVRCKDCAKRECCRTSTVWAVPPNDDWYCADAERRTDERLNQQTAAIDAAWVLHPDDRDALRDTLKELPSAQQGQKKGEWIRDKKTEKEEQLMFHKVWTCSECGEQQCRPKPSNFCPNCGADMRGEL